MKKKFFTSELRNLGFCLGVLLWGLQGCGQKEQQQGQSSSQGSSQQPQPVPFGKTKAGQQTQAYTLTNGKGMKAVITNYGGRLVSLQVPGRDGNPVEVVVGFRNAAEYEAATEPYFGALIGRVGNRIANGKFTLDGKEYTLFKNNGPNTLHGGKMGFQYVLWQAKQTDEKTLELTYTSPNMEEGFPGKLEVKVMYEVEVGNRLRITYEATTDKKTLVNLTNHAFFNLNGEGSGTILNHVLQIPADRYLPVDSTLIPTGEFAPVQGTPFDFRQPTAIGARIGQSHPQLVNGKGYDHNFVLREKRTQTLQPAATVTGDQSGIQLEITSLEPGIQFYSGNFMQGKNTFKNGSKDDFRTAFCLEPQHFPDAPHHPEFPSIELEPGKTYKTVSLYKFSVPGKGK